MAGASGRTDVKNLDYFYTQFSNVDQVRHYMEENHFTEGQYLLRPSCTNKNRLAISVVVAGGKVCHLNVKYDHSGFYLAPERKFRSLEALFHHYSHNDINNTEKVNNVRLLDPIPCGKRPATKSTRHSVTNARAARGSDASSHSSSGSSGTSAKPRSLSECAAVFDERAPYLIPQMPQLHPYGSTPAPGAATSSPHLTQHPLPPSMLNRPLPQPPPIHERLSDKPPNYSSPFDSKQAKVQLNFVDPKRENLCQCGLRADIVDLPRGWTIHLSQRDEVHSMQCVFFQSSYNETSWVLPPDVVSLLNVTQREVLKQLAHNYAYANENTCFG